MEKQFYGIKVEKITDDALEIRFYSKNDVRLTIKQIQPYDAQGKAEDMKITAICPVFLHNNFKIIPFTGFKKPVSEYKSLRFRVIDETNSLRDDVHIDLRSKEIKYARMQFHGNFHLIK